MNTKDHLQKKFITLAVFLIFAAVIISHLLFAFTDTKLTTSLDASYGHNIYETSVMLKNILTGKTPLNSIRALPAANLSEIYLAVALIILPKSITTFKMLHLLPLLLGLLGIYLTTKEIKNSLAGLLALLFAASSAGIIAFSRQIWPHFYLAIGLLWGIFFIIKSDYGKNFRPLLAAIIILLITGKTHYSALAYSLLIITPALFSIHKNRTTAILFWFTATAISLFGCLYICKLIITASASALIIANRKNKQLRNWLAVTTLFTLTTSLPSDTLLAQTAQNMYSYLSLTESLYFVSFIRIIGPVFMITAFVYLLKPQLHNHSRLIFAALIVPETLMLLSQLFRIYPVPRGLNTYIIGLIPTFVLSGIFFAEKSKKISAVAISIGIILFITHSFYLPYAEINKKAKKTLMVFNSEKKSFGKKELSEFMQNLDPNKTVGVLHPFIPTDIYPNQISFTNKTSLWLLAGNDTSIVSIIDPIQETPSQIMLFKCDYFLFEKTSDPHEVIETTLELMEANPLFELEKSIRCPEKEILIYRREKVSNVVAKHLTKMIISKIRNSQAPTAH